MRMALRFLSPVQQAPVLSPTPNLLIDKHRQTGSVALSQAIRPQIVQCPCMTASALSILFFARFSGKERKESLWRGERSQGRRSLAFISTLDTGLRTFTIDPGTKVRVLF